MSGGQKQRTGLARAALWIALANCARWSPIPNLDEAGEAALARAIAPCRERGATVVMVTHRGSIPATTTRLLEVLRDGTAQAFGPTQGGAARHAADAAATGARKAGAQAGAGRGRRHSE
ncbi:hypothetical protein ACU4GD_14875 [Cupriavidus basilensis]